MATLALTRLQQWKAFATPKIPRVVEFLTRQGITVAGNLVYGFLCVRLLPIPEYAKFAVVFGFLGPLSVLMDVTFSNTLLPLVGEEVDNLDLIADYVASLRQLARWLFLIVAPGAIVAYPLIIRRQQWSWPVIASMLAILLVAAWFTRVTGAYGVVLIVRRDRKYWYRAQMASSLGTLVLLVIVWAAHGLNAFSAILINVAGIVFLATCFYLRSRRLLGVGGRSSAEKRRAIIHLSLPTLPNAVFYALQGQISMLLITVFGHVASVASVGALTRLAQIFVVFSQMTPVLIEPYFARLPTERVKRNYLGIVAVEMLFCLFLSAAARLFPQVFLWILGPKYSGLRYEVFLVILANSMAYLCGVLCAIHNSRRFVYWWNGIVTIVSTLLLEVIYIVKFDISTVRGVLQLNLLVAALILLINVLTGAYGFIIGPRKLHNFNASEVA